MSNEGAYDLPALVDHRLPLGVLGLDRHGRVIARNDVARSILRERDGVALQHDHLVAARPPESAALHRLVARACKGDDQTPPAGGMVQISRPPPKAALSVLVTPLRHLVATEASATPVAVVFISDPDQPFGTFGDLLRQLYRLTPAEVDVALLVLAGTRVESIARRRRTTRNTVRTHLKRIFDKVGVQSQTDLVRLLLTGSGRHVVEHAPERPSTVAPAAAVRGRGAQ
jgi:DNA-binding CsgD family transcriptional regulator